MRDAKGRWTGRGGRWARPQAREGGFTLIELIVVIAIICILMALLAVFISGITDRAASAKCKAIIQAMDGGCKAYKVDFNTYPPNDKGDSRNLFYYLGRTRLVSMGSVDTGPLLRVKKPPYVSFPADWLQLAKGAIPDPTQPVPVVDPWDNPIKYMLPGTYNKPGPDIWSMGPNGQDDIVPPGGDTDDISNWVKDF